MTLQADQVFVFAGAGISASMPSGLPMFDSLRDEILTQLGLGSYVESAQTLSSNPQEQADSIALPGRMILGPAQR